MEFKITRIDPTNVNKTNNDLQMSTNVPPQQEASIVISRLTREIDVVAFEISVIDYVSSFFSLDSVNILSV